MLFSSDEGMKRIKEATYQADFYKLANNFESQSNGAVCGPTTATIVLNSLNRDILRSNELKINKDTTSISANEIKYIRKGLDPFLNQYTQNNIFDVAGGQNSSKENIKTKEEMYGKPVDGVSSGGFQLRELHQLFLAHHVKSELIVVTDQSEDEKIKAEILLNLATPDDFVVVNYKRSAMGQSGGGHISPLGAYHKPSDSVLIMDVNPAKADWVWVKMTDLISAMRTMDTVENRGYLLVSKK
ncbi:MAG: phytochelatin synthase family protein [Bdellovibrionota bacterium]